LVLLVMIAGPPRPLRPSTLPDSVSDADALVTTRSSDIYHRVARLAGALALAIGFGRAAEVPSQFAFLDGVRVHYKSYGTGPLAVIFVHGWACNLTFWRLQTPVGEGSRRLFLDLPGHGKSDKPEIAYTEDLFARAVDAVIRDARVEKAILVGHSLGAAVALHFARRYPSKLLGLVLVDGALPNSADPASESARFANRLPGLQGSDYLKSAANFINVMFIPQTQPALRDEIRTKMLETPQHVMVSAMEGLADPAIWKVDPIKVPVLIINARKIHPHTDEAFLRNMLPNLDFESWDDVGHFLMMEKPKEFNDSLTRFVRRNWQLSSNIN